MLTKLSIAILSAWLALTLFTDFVVIRTAFELTGDFFKAGDIGIALFGKLNNFEIIFGSFILVEAVFKRKILPLILSLILFSIALIYFSYLTSKISALTELWKEAEKAGVLSMGNISDVQAEHQFFHRLYIGLDTLKMILLAALLSIKISRRDA